MDRIGGWVLDDSAAVPPRQQQARRMAAGARVPRRARRNAQGRNRTARQACAGQDRTAAGARRREERPRQARTADPAVPRRRRHGHPAARAARRSEAAGEGLQRGNARDAFAPDRIQAQGLPHRRAGRRRLSGPGDHALRARARAGRQGQPDFLARQGHRARPVGEVGARGRRDPGQVGGRPGNAEHHARDDLPQRAAALEGIRQVRQPADARARQGHRRPADGRRPRDACRTCSSPAPPARASRSRSTRWCCRCCTRRPRRTCAC